MTKINQTVFEIFSKNLHGAILLLPPPPSPGAHSKFGGCQGRRTGMGVTTVSNSLILGGWMTKVLKNGAQKGGGVEGWVTTIIRLFRPTVLDKKWHFPVYFYTHLSIY